MRTAALKLGRLVFVLFVVTFLSFWMLKLQERKGDLVSTLAPFASPAEKARLREDIGLNKPFFVQYKDWVTNFVQGDFGKTYTGTGAHVSGVPVSDGLWKRLPVSLELMLYAQILALVIAIPMGVLTAYRNGTKFDRISNVLAFAMLAMPAFLAALLLVIYVAAKWHVWDLPTQYTGVGDFPLNPFTSENWKQMLLPTISLAVAQIAIYMRLLRSDMIATLQEDFITTAKAKGIPAAARAVPPRAPAVEPDPAHGRRPQRRCPHRRRAGRRAHLQPAGRRRSPRRDDPQPSAHRDPGPRRGDRGDLRARQLRRRPPLHRPGPEDPPCPRDRLTPVPTSRRRWPRTSTVTH